MKANELKLDKKKKPQGQQQYIKTIDDLLTLYCIRYGHGGHTYTVDAKERRYATGSKIPVPGV